MYKFEKLSVWQEALKLAQEGYAFSRQLPKIEQFGLSDQLRRASTSVLLNIGEGSGADTDKEFLRFLFMARKSMFEIVALVRFIELEYSGVNSKKLLNQVELTGKLLSGLIKKLKAESK